MSMNQEDQTIEEKQAVPPKKRFSFRKKAERLAEGSRSEQKRKQKNNNKLPRLRVFPIWLRIIVVLLLCLIALVIGLMIGYGVIGDGAPVDALKKETWQHIIDIVIKTE
ncbi:MULTISPECIES: DNA-directed RNA polymerase subunit beta [Virgibacillus]|uniref:DNA-directed RNA polymerase subunit beta n=2 Tax=Virgibacillus TaxID=84406 RepID=A0A024Q719_9BACI|nr:MULTISPECIES: DNA-directed RNA polymerase subunit beta [Virgibacillus]EQB38168.1 hypothetical protein M948_06220 [Virgibacillus sp. CM-4]MYL40874.1 DNA-directed RNA polymerase subunit beta [Virgibacillus massiliensis]GGJ52468.1 hypothetical protein GCM10007111_13290 [Virgibacillus kapii]CDQ38328.1 DNA-directed RNA polymerase subunit beta [Virgibacillus massiliensis]